jgi:hypothetical protein
MLYSRTHLEMAKHLKTIDVLTNPQHFLGSNWEKVLAFWFFIDYLSGDDIKAMNDRHSFLEEDVRLSARRAIFSTIVYDHEECKFKETPEVVNERLRNAVHFAVHRGDYSLNTKHDYNNLLSQASLELIANLTDTVFYNLVMNQ